MTFCFMNLTLSSFDSLSKSKSLAATAEPLPSPLPAAALPALPVALPALPSAAASEISAASATVVAASDCGGGGGEAPVATIRFVNNSIEPEPLLFEFSGRTELLRPGEVGRPLEVVVAAKKRVVTRFRQASTPVGKVIAAVLVWAVLFGSKFLVLESVALVFGPRVSLGGFFSVTALIVVLMLSRAGVRRLLESSGSPA